MGSIDDLVRDLKKFSNSKEVTKELRKELRRPIPRVRKAIKARAIRTLPAANGLNIWVSKTRITAVIKLSGRKAGVKLKGGRNSEGARSDMRKIDKGKIRHPSWGRKYAGQWHNQQVKAGFFTQPATEVDQWRDACITAVDNALDTIRKG